MDATTLFENAINHWRDAKGKGTALIPKPLDDREMLLKALLKVYGKHQDANMLIIVKDFLVRKNLTEYLTTQAGDANDTFKSLFRTGQLRILTGNYINCVEYFINPFLTVLYRCDELLETVYLTLKRSKFCLAILNRLSLNREELTKLYSICPMLSDFEQNVIDEIRISTPVEETLVGVLIPPDTEEYKLFQYYSEYISTSISIFGDFDRLQYARTGHAGFGYSATQYCYKLALENGWNDKLDMSIEYNAQIDNLYNPANIRERASQTYEIMRSRRNLLADYSKKLDEILEIVKEHQDEHILIINKNGEFASKVTKFLNEKSDRNICGNYHDRVDPIPAIEIDGTPLFVKSGKNKGERKFFAAKAQKSLNEGRFNAGYINVLSTNNAPDKDLSIPVDVVIITSPECEEIESYLYRLNNVSFPKGVVKLYTLYVRNSSEEKKAMNRPLSETHKVEINVKNDSDFDFFAID